MTDIRLYSTQINSDVEVKVRDTEREASEVPIATVTVEHDGLSLILCVTVEDHDALGPIITEVR